MEKQKNENEIKWEKPRLVLISSVESSENVLSGSGNPIRPSSAPGFSPDQG
jgi:hypothetical protein